MYGSFMSTPSTKGVDNKRLQSFPGFFSSNSPQNQTAFGSATLPTYPQQTSAGAGMTKAGVRRHRAENPGSKLQTAVTGKVEPGSKAAKRRKSFCARMKGMPGPMKDSKGRPTRKAASLKRWRCK